MSYNIIQAKHCSFPKNSTQTLTQYTLTFEKLKHFILLFSIEHLYDDTISAMAEHLFQVIRPKVVVITTPNSEYNILFPDFSGMRHWDHKFEWDREQFAKWYVNLLVTRSTRWCGLAFPVIHP